MAKVKEEKLSKEELLESLEKKYGMWRPEVNNLTVVSTGSIQLDRAMRIGGTALGKIIEILGPESSGKSTIALHQIAEYQKAFPERKVCLMNFEHAFDPNYASLIGVDVDSLLLYQPDDMESGYDMSLGLIANDIVSCIIIDSQTSATPKAVKEGEMGDATIGLQARINSKFCMKVKGLLDIHHCTLFFISQLRNKIGSMSSDGLVATGGEAIKYYADVRWKLWKTHDKLNEANKTTVDVIKSKVGKVFGQAKIDILWGVGIDKIGEIVNYAVDLGIMKRAGAWYSYADSNIGQGMDKTRIMLEDNPELLEEIKNKVLEKL